MRQAKGKPKVDWYKRFNNAREPHVVTLSANFAGVKAGSTMLISSPAQIASYLASIPQGETRTIARMRSDLARRSRADAMCPVTTAIYLRVVAEVALQDLTQGKGMDAVAPFWRLVTPDSKVAQGLSCGPEGVEHLARLDAI
ncbi:hypothetical protein [Phreatobacter sp.]|uniref:hypothetical protein n=1 Tax=Phreatobacter sp. TaxID=1966341 RepID=UPI0022BDD08E|nr:hypothetical protein [Phreatobacter sp.]MCZ8315143.1 hypothetical protein [Phreatobacter sp.]